MSFVPGAAGAPATFPAGLVGGGNANIRASEGAGTTTLVAGTDNPSQVFNLSASRTVVLPSTGVNAGDVWVLENRAAFDMIVQSSALTALTVANSANQDATVQQGYVVLRALQALPTTPAHWLVEYVRDEAQYTGTTSGAIAVAFTINFLRINRLVSLQALSASGTGTTNTITASAGPVRIRPVSGGRYSGTAVVFNSTIVGGYCVMSTDGTTVWRKYDLSSFSGSCAIGSSPDFTHAVYAL